MCHTSKSVSDQTLEFNVAGSSKIGNIQGLWRPETKTVIVNHMCLLEGLKEGILVLHPLDMELLFPINLF